MLRSVAILPFALLLACGAAPSPPVTTAATTSSAASPTPTAASETDSSGEKCDLVCGAAAAVHAEPAAGDTHNADVSNADAVFASMHDDLLACYKARIAQRPSAHAYLVVDLIVAPDGSVQHLDMTGGALLGEAGTRCVTQRIQRASFAPVRGGGTLHIQVPLNFTRTSADDST